MLSSLGILRILAESREHIVGAVIGSIEYYRKERAVQLYLKRERSYCLTMSFHPQHHGFYILPAGKSRIDTPEKYRPFAREIWDRTVTEVNQLPNDRIIELAIGSGAPAFLVLEILGPNANMLLLDSSRKFTDSLRERRGSSGAIYQPAALPPKRNPFEITADEIRDLLSADEEINLLRRFEKGVYGIDYYLAGEIIGHDLLHATEVSLSQAAEIQKRLQEILKKCADPEAPIYPCRIRGKIHYYPVTIAGHEPLGKFSSLSEAQLDLRAAERETTDTQAHQENALKQIETKIKKAERLLPELDRDIEEASDYELYRRYADLLKIHMGKLRRGMAGLQVDDLFGDGQIEIPLDPKLTGKENIEQYSKRYRKGKEGLALLQRRRENIVAEIADLQKALTAFAQDFETASDSYPELVPASAGAPTGKPQPRLPYKEYLTSTGLTILLGKTGDDNDRTTFGFAKPYELWFHASQCPGSHVVMKFPHKNFEPSKQEIEEAAQLAAWFSKARGSARVAVSYTQKKHVHKPRKAKAGLVTIQQEKTIMVAPRELAKKV